MFAAANILLTDNDDVKVNSLCFRKHAIIRFTVEHEQLGMNAYIYFGDGMK